ncbi:MAG: hypothetical protein ACRD4X_08220 [Candidatus Acidiferrales bacterium]
MKNSGGRKSKAAEQMEAEIENHEQARRDQERDNQQDLIQHVQSASHDTQRLGVKWPPSYKALKKRKPAAKPASKRGK